MSALVLLLLSSTASAGSTSFYPGSGPETVEIAPDGTLGGVPVRRTGALLAEATDPAAIAALAEVGQVEALPGGVLRIRPRSGLDEIALSRRLRGRADVAWAHPDLAYRLVPHEIPDDPFFPDQWHLQNTGQSGGEPGADVNAPMAWEVTAGEGILVAIIDSGVETAHPDLRVSSGHDYVDGDDDSNPTDNAHGTSAAGLVAAVGDNGLGVAGVAWGASIYGVRLIGGETTIGDVYSAFVESVDAGAAVLNNSWGYGEGCPDLPLFGALERAVEYAEEEGRGGLGTVVVFSAGNGGCDASNNELLAHPWVVAVAAINHLDEREGYSSYGSMLDVTAPSGGVLTTDMSGDAGYGDWRGDRDYTGGFSGTSASAPVVSGVLALMLAANPELTAAEAREVLCATATRMDLEGGEYDETGWSPWHGCGRVDAGAAVNAVKNAPPGAPVPLGPASPTPERVILSWEPAVDPDGDRLSYEVAWWVGEAGAEGAMVATTGGDTLDLTREVQEGDVVSWTVTAVDAWSASLPSEVSIFRVEASPEPPPVDTAENEVVVRRRSEGSCSTLPSPIPVMGGMTGLLLLLRRRRAGPA